MPALVFPHWFIVKTKVKCHYMFGCAAVSHVFWGCSEGNAPNSKLPGWLCPHDDWHRRAQRSHLDGGGQMRPNEATSQLPMGFVIVRILDRWSWDPGSSTSCSQQPAGFLHLGQGIHHRGLCRDARSIGGTGQEKRGLALLWDKKPWGWTYSVLGCVM